MLTFDDPTHTYRWRGQVVPGVTSILSPLTDWSKVPRDILLAAQQRGTYVHRMTELYDLVQLDEGAILASPEHAVYHGYLRAYKAFLDEYDPVWHEIEQMGYSERHGYAGTWDRAGEFFRKWPGRWTVDIKTALADSDSWGVQLAAYRQIRAERDMRAALDRRGSLQLHADGTFDFQPYDQPDDWECFRALLTVMQWRSKR